MNKIIAAIVACFCLYLPLAHAEERFLLMDASDGKIVMKLGEDRQLEERVTPYCTFNIALSLMGYDLGILEDENSPAWPYMGEEVVFDSWKEPQTPKSWMNLSVVWYGRRLSPKIGMENLERYLGLFDYGNRDMCGDPGENNGVTRAWVSSLKISMLEQAGFLRKLVHGNLPVSAYALQMTKNILLNQTLDSGWNLFGKTGTGAERQPDGSFNFALGEGPSWYVGWISKDSQTYVFALLLRNMGRFIDKAARQAIVKQHFREAGIAID